MGGDIGIDPCLHIIFYMESAIQQLIAEYLLGGGKAGQQDPASRARVNKIHRVRIRYPGASFSSFFQRTGSLCSFSFF